MANKKFDRGKKPSADFDYELKAHRHVIEEFVQKYTETHNFRTHVENLFKVYTNEAEGCFKTRVEALFNDFYPKYKAEKRHAFWKHPLLCSLVGGGIVVGIVELIRWFSKR